MKNIVRGAGLLTFGAAGVALLSFLRNLVVIRLLTVEDFGIASLFAITMSMIEMASEVGLGRFIIREKKINPTKLLNVSHTFQVFRGVILSISLYILAPLITEFFSIQSTTWAFQFLAVVPLIRGFAHLDVFRLQKKMAFLPWVIADTFPYLISFIFIYPLSLYTKDYSLVLWIIIIQSLVYVLLTHLLSRKTYTWEVDKNVLKKIYVFGWPLLINNIFMFIIFQGDKALVGSVFSLEVLGWFSAAFLLSITPAALVTKVTSSLFLPYLSSVQNNLKELNNRFSNVVQISFVLGLLFAFLFLFIGDVLVVFLFGEKYYQASMIVAWLGAAQGFRIAKSGVIVTSIAVARTKLPMYANAIRAIFLLFAFILLVLGYKEILIVVFFAFVGEMMSFFASLFIIKKYINEFSLHFVKRIFIIMLISYAAIISMNYFVGSVALGWRLLHLLLFSLLLLSIYRSLLLKFIRLKINININGYGS